MRIETWLGADRWVKPSSPDDPVEPGYDEWLAAEIEAATAELEAGAGHSRRTGLEGPRPRMRLVFSPRAANRLREIQSYIAFEANLPTALRVVLRIRQSAEMLADFPKLGADGKEVRPELWS